MKVFGIVSINSGVLVATFMANLVEVLQVLLLTVTLLISSVHLCRMWWRWGRERRLAEVVNRARTECEKAESGDCPVQKMLAELEQKGK